MSSFESAGWRWATAVIVFVVATGAGAADDGLVTVRSGPDVEILRGGPDDALGTQSSDPLGLLVGVATLRDHSLGQDRFDVWACGVSQSATTLANQLRDNVGAYFRYHSRGRYEPVFRARGYAGSSDQECRSHSFQNASGDANGALHIVPRGGGYASPGLVCGFSPCSNSTYYKNGNGRAGFIGNAAAFYSTAAHEIGHMIQWPHSYTGLRHDFWREYDNALDLMSGNWGVFSGGYGSYPDPYSTAVINFYAAGWIDPHEVYVYGGPGATFNLATAGGSGYRMAVIESGSRYYTLAARLRSSHDPIPSHWTGVEVYQVEKCRGSEWDCLFDDEMLPGFRRVKPHPAVSFQFQSRSSYDQPLPHVIRPGTSRLVAGVNVEVGAVSGQALRISIGPDPKPIPDPQPVGGSFTDTSGHVFEADIAWLAEAGITRGCNPPQNSRFCPDDPVTRGQMAAFLVRALGLTERGAKSFTDTSGHVFEADIERLAEAGITRGCNPPQNSRFCPDDPVTRGQMAAFLHRALPGLPAGSAIAFVDTRGHVFESDIAWLAATGVTRGCNPPANDRFCPESPVTRGQMAAFLHRALGG